MLGARRPGKAFMNGGNTPHFPRGGGARYSASMHPVPATALLHVDGLALSWPDATRQFTDLHLALGSGVTLLQGDSGSGKTTLLRLVAGELVATGGRIALRGRTRDDDPAAWARAVGFLDAEDDRLDAWTAAGVLATLRARHGSVDESAWQRHVEGFALQPHLAKPMYQLSTGSRRKAALAATLAARCTLTLLDEPGAGLDAASLRHLRQALREAGSDPTRAMLVVAGIGLDGLECNATVTLPAQESA
jgi:ABC-type multidrug transport system ATPase subunit